ncbi:hypothetical protein WME79_41160 [Sorangium sp. So ce726]|uniref:hypothetical protein n=1 Tax=Sorangium sp. So ce726 TaxID=3133319 RepID=UPI003F60B95B
MSNLSAIGFAVSSEDDLRRTVGAALERAAPPPDLGASAAHYLWFRDASGAALAVRLDAGKEIECITPFFAAPDGGTRWRVHTSAPHLDRECLHCSGADCDVLDPSSGEMYTRTALQFLFFEPYQAWLADERTFEVVVVGFASSLSLCATPDDLERAQAALFGDAEPGVPREPGKPMRLADQAFLPHGMFGAEGELGARARALLTGNVESVTLARNEITGSRFVHTRVRTLGGPIDIVAPADAVEVPERATLVVADCWLVGRPVEAPPPKTGFFRSILGRA